METTHTGTDENILTFKDKTLVFLSYIFFFPSIYVILSDKRKNELLALHAAQAFLYWLAVAVIFLMLRAAVYLIVSVLPLYFLTGAMDLFFLLGWFFSFYCAIMFLFGAEVEIPIVHGISKKIIRKYF